MEGAATGAADVPVRLRGHHFLCILTFQGAGYTPAFVVHMQARVRQIAVGARVQLVEGPDAICAGLTERCRRDVDHDCAAAPTLVLDRLAVEDVNRALGRDISEAAPLTRVEIVTLRAAFADGAIRRACANCAWHGLCDAIVARGYAGAQL